MSRTYEALIIDEKDGTSRKVAVRFEECGDISRYNWQTGEYDIVAEQLSDIDRAILSYYYPFKYIMPNGWNVSEGEQTK
jgi:hypothetical protein